MTSPSTSVRKSAWRSDQTQAAARYFAATQMHAFDFGRVNPDFVERLGFGKAGDVACGEFEGKAVFCLTVGVFLVDNGQLIASYMEVDSNRNAIYHWLN